jgi:predicted Na+-dependent transporter
MGRKALSTLEWIVIAVIAIAMITYVLGYWAGIWGTATSAAEKANSTFASAVGRLFGK